MTHEQYVACVIACLIGNVVHVCCKIYSLSTDSKKANVEFSFLHFVALDKWALIVDLVVSLAIVYLADEWLDLDSRIISKIKSIFFFVGFSGSYIVFLVMSRAQDLVRKRIDEKTNEIDKLNNTLDKPTPLK